MMKRAAHKIMAAVLVFVVFTGTAAAQRLAVSADIANIRSGPGTGYDVIWQVEKYYPIEVVNTSGNWYHFRDFEGDEGWVHQSLVDKLSTVITVRPKCNVRSGPGIQFDIVFTVEKGIPFNILKKQGKWINIQHADGDSGWIFRSLVW